MCAQGLSLPEFERSNTGLHGDPGYTRWPRARLGSNPPPRHPGQAGGQQYFHSFSGSGCLGTDRKSSFWELWRPRPAGKPANPVGREAAHWFDGFSGRPRNDPTPRKTKKQRFSVGPQTPTNWGNVVHGQVKHSFLILVFGLGQELATKWF